MFQNLINLNTNCYPKCEGFYYFDENNEFKCNRNKICPSDYNKLIKEKNKCIDKCSNDDIYKYEFNNICLKECPKEANKNNNYTCLKKDETYGIISFTDKITNDIIDKFYIKYISEYNITENKDIIIDKKLEEDIIYQITTINNQNNNNKQILSSINFNSCEKRLKNIYNINEGLSLIILKIDYFPPDTLIPIIGYELYHPWNKSKLNLSYCEDILIQLNISVS